MKILLRIIITSVTAVATFYFVVWIGTALLFLIFFGARGVPPESSAAAPGILTVIGIAIAIAVAILVARYVWKHSAALRGGLVRCILLGAFVTGGIGFVGGFFGPLVFAPGANQGPLLGIFITGPLGFLLGAVGGAIYWARWGRRQASASRGGTAEEAIAPVTEERRGL